MVPAGGRGRSWLSNIGGERYSIEDNGPKFKFVFRSNTHWNRSNVLLYLYILAN